MRLKAIAIAAGILILVASPTGAQERRDLLYDGPMQVEHALARVGWMVETFGLSEKDAKLIYLNCTSTCIEAPRDESSGQERIIYGYTWGILSPSPAEPVQPQS